MEETKAVASFLHIDNIIYNGRAPVYAHTHVGHDGRLFYGNGMIKTEQSLELLQLLAVPDPYDDAFYS